MDNHNIQGSGVLAKRTILLLGMLGCLAVSAVITYMGLTTYRHYKKELIASEQNELLMMAKTIGKSLANYIEQELDCLDLYCLMMESEASMTDQKQIEQAVRLYLNRKGELYSAAAYFDRDRQKKVLVGETDFSADMLPDSDKAEICGKNLTKDGGYQLYIARALHLKDAESYVVYGMDLDEIYREIVAPVQIGEGGYSIVKDRNLSILMHHAPSQIGMDAVYDRSERYPDLDLEDLSAWLELQRAQPEGVGIIHSYMWDDPELLPVERIAAYTAVNIRQETWIVNSTLPYKEIEQPLAQMLRRLMGVCLAIIICSSVLIAVITRSLFLARSQKKEINYLREINVGMELLRHKEEEIQHYQRVQSIGQMSSQIAHEFNNYLTPVMVYGELLSEDETIGSENQKLVEGILKSTNQAAELSRKLLDFSRQETSVVLDPIDLAGETRESIHMIRQLAPQKIKVVDHLSESPLFTMGQKGMMEHILMNLCNNAFHAMEESGGTLTVCLAKATETDNTVGLAATGFHTVPDKDWIVLSVRDTGCGIHKDAIDKIFEPFYTTKRSGKGTGLGLSVIHNIVTGVGGHIRVDTEENKGTCFYLFFPALSEAKLISSKKSGDGKKADTKLHLRKIVVVDDDPELLKSLRTMIQPLGIPCEILHHPATVIAKIQNNPNYCDLILTDYSMASMNGIELCELIRKLNPDIYLVLMSGLSDISFDWYLKNRFIDEFILKTELANRLPKLLG